MKKTSKNNNSVTCDNLYTIQTSKNVLLYTDIMKQTTKDTAEQSVDMIIKQLKDGQIDLDTAKKNIMNVDNLQFLGINYDNVDEVIEENAHA